MAVVEETLGAVAFGFTSRGAAIYTEEPWFAYYHDEDPWFVTFHGGLDEEEVEDA